MTVVVLILLAGFLVATVLAPAFDQWRRRRAELRRLPRIVVNPPRWDGGPRWPRDSVSPQPRRRAS